MSFSINPERKQELLACVNAYIDNHYTGLKLPAFDNGIMFCLDDETEDTAVTSSPCQETHLLDDDWDCLDRIFKKKDTLHSLIEQAETAETFSQTLLRIIQEKQLTEPEVYNSVFMDRKLFNKIRNTPEYQPSKRTACLLAVALKLNLEETQVFLGKAGYKLSSKSQTNCKRND